jgi:hypothetical protein
VEAALAAFFSAQREAGEALKFKQACAHRMSTAITIRGVRSLIFHGSCGEKTCGKHVKSRGMPLIDLLINWVASVAGEPVAMLIARKKMTGLADEAVHPFPPPSYSTTCRVRAV